MTNEIENNAYTSLARHFDAKVLPSLLKTYLPRKPLALADLGCGDGPFFQALYQEGYISPATTIYAVDLQRDRLDRVAVRFPFIITIQAPVDSVPTISDGALDFTISTMVMEHVYDESKYLDEIQRILKPGGLAYITTVFKRRWAWYFRCREGKPVLDTSHLREYTDLNSFKNLLMQNDRFSALLALELTQLWFPLIDPFLFRLAKGRNWPRLAGFLSFTRLIKIPIPGYYTLSIVVRR